VDLTLHAGRGDDLEPLVDLALVDAATADLLGEPLHQTGRAVAVKTPPPQELPLFSARGDEDAPLITRASPPRTPLAVLRATPEVPRLRQESRTAAYDLPLPGLEPAVTPRPTPSGSRVAAAVSAPAATAEAVAASVIARAVASAVDLTVLAGIDAIVVYFTMQVCGLTQQEMAMIPKAPLVAFLLLQNLSYFVAFTAGGQTLGKMLTGIKIIGASGASPDLAQSLRRTLVWLLLIVPAGLGLVTTLFDSQRRGLHDRFAATRVVRAGA
jgi:uncharacterized RDD family membrane protein YckC